MSAVKKTNEPLGLGVTRDNTRAVNIGLLPRFRLVILSPVVQQQAPAAGGDGRWPIFTAQNKSSFW